MSTQCCAYASSYLAETKPLSAMIEPFGGPESPAVSGEGWAKTSRPHPTRHQAISVQSPCLVLDDSLKHTRAQLVVVVCLFQSAYLEYRILKIWKAGFRTTIEKKKSRSHQSKRNQEIGCVETTIQKLRFRNYDSETTAIQKLSRFRN